MEPAMRLHLWKLCTYGILVLATTITLIPFAYLTCGAFKTPHDAFQYMFLPAGEGWFGVGWDKLTLSNIQKLLVELNFGQHLLNSFFLASVTSALATLCSAMAGYALAKMRFLGRKLLLACAIVVLVVPSVLLLPATYQLLYRLGLIDSYWGLILPALAPAMGIYLFRQSFIGSVPNDLLEAARMDGCGEIRIFFRIALPLVQPMTGTFMMITFLATWNNYIGPQIILHSPEKIPLAVAVAQLKGIYSHEYSTLLAGTFVSVLPVIGLFSLFQKDFESGLTTSVARR